MSNQVLSAKQTKNFSQLATFEELERAKASLEANGFIVKVVNNLEEARETVLSMVPAKSEVFTATSVTLTESGLDNALNDNKRYNSVRDKFMPLYADKDRAVEMRRIGSGSDFAVGSVHAITEDGQVIIASASGSQLPNYAYGASSVIWVVGAQKIVKNLSEGIRRIEEHSFKLEDKRAQSAYGVHSSINKLLLYRKEPNKRVSIVIVRQAVGF